MLAYHPDEAANAVLNVLDRESRSVVGGIELRVLEFKWDYAGYADADLEPALQRLEREGLAQRSGGMLRLSAAGYARLTAPEVPALPEPTAPPASGRITEYALRNRLLEVFRSIGADAGSAVTATELARYWDVSRQRAADLRAGLDLLMRDRHARVGRFRKTRFRLEADGQQYLEGLEAPESLAERAVPLIPENLRRLSVPDRSLCVLAAYLFRGPLELRPVGFGELDYLLERYGLPDFARFHAIDLLHRLGYARLGPDGRSLLLTQSGRQLRGLAESGSMQALISDDLRNAVRSQ